MTEPSQKAREAAAELFAAMGGTRTGCCMIRQAEADEAPAVRHFAAFEAAIRAECGAVAERVVYDYAQRRRLHSAEKCDDCYIWAEADSRYIRQSVQYGKIGACDDQPEVPTPDAESVGRQAAAEQLRKCASDLRTPAGRAKAQWHESDAEMVANELDRQATTIAKGTTHA